MIDRLRVLGLVCARGGSKSVPRKNLAELEGSPLIVHTIRTFQDWGRADRVLCSTDDEEIAAVATAAGASVPWLRPAELAGDAVSKMPVMTHALVEAEREDGVEYDIVVDLDVAAPIRHTADVDGTVRAMLDAGAQNAFSVTPARRNPYFDMVELDDRGRAQLVKPLSAAPSSRQMSPVVYDLNASVYAFRREFLLAGPDTPVGDDTVVFVMPPERSVEVDEPFDLLMVETILGAGLAELPAPGQGRPA